jgi:membrane protein required for colicin V production
MLGWLDKLLGGVFSWVKCLVILSVLLYSFGKINGYFHFVSDEYLSQTILYEPIRSIAYLFFKGETIDV